MTDADTLLVVVGGLLELGAPGVFLGLLFWALRGMQQHCDQLQAETVQLQQRLIDAQREHIRDLRTLAGISYNGRASALPSDTRPLPAFLDETKS